MPTYKISAKKLGRECNFEATALDRQDVVKKASEHAKVCSVCSGLTEDQVAKAVEEIQ